MTNSEYKEDFYSEMIEDSFVNIKEVCLRLQERTKCKNDFVIKMLNDVAEIYMLQDSKHRS